MRFAPQSASVVHWHSPPWHAPVVQVPQDPPQPSLPQASPSHEGVHVAAHVPLLVLHFSPVLQLPHVPPQPSLPHARPLQLGVHGGGSGSCGSPGLTGSVGSAPASAEILWTVVVVHAASESATVQMATQKAARRRTERWLIPGGEPPRPHLSQRIFAL
jgi:hypothetical protein